LNPTWHPLAGRTILVTRPQEQADGLCQRIEAAGGRALRLPLLVIEAVETPVMAHCLAEPWDWILFISHNAVRYAAPWLTECKPEARIAAIGANTAMSLAKQGIRVDLTPELEFNSESLLAMPELMAVDGRKILIVRGQGGREHLGDTLGRRGATVAYAEVYRRVPAVIDPEPWRQCGPAGTLHALTLTSGEALDHLHHALRDVVSGWMQTLPLVIPGSRLECLARDKGWQRVKVATQPGDAAMLRAVIEVIGTDQHGFTSDGSG
jgi:uroporphyrinogen-III synthase